MAWTKALGRRPWLDGRSLRDLLAWRGVSLWWFAELYLHHSTRRRAACAPSRPARASWSASGPDEVEAVGLPEEEALLLARTCSALRRALPARPAVPRAAGAWRGVVGAAGWNTAEDRCSRRSRPASSARPPLPRPTRAADGALPLPRRLLAGARRSGDGETRRLRALLRPPDSRAWTRSPGCGPFVVAVGPAGRLPAPGAERAAARTGCGLRGRRAAYVHVNRFTPCACCASVWRGTRAVRALGAACAAAPGLPEAFSHRGVRLRGPLATATWPATLLLQLPWAVRCYEEMRAALARVRPAALCLYAESSGWGRAALAACRAAGRAQRSAHPARDPVSEVLSRTATSPTRRTARSPTARRSSARPRGGCWSTLGRYRPRASSVTGSPKFDELLRRGARAGTAGRCAPRLGVRRRRAAGGGGQPLPRHTRDPPVDRQRVRRHWCARSRPCRACAAS